MILSCYSMALRTDKELKIYYSISEVAQMFGVNESLLRYWEKEFPFIAPKKQVEISVSIEKKTSTMSGWYIIL